MDVCVCSLKMLLCLKESGEIVRRLRCYARPTGDADFIRVECCQFLDPAFTARLIAFVFT